jgi:hypothetical protein
MIFDRLRLDGGDFDGMCWAVKRPVRRPRIDRGVGPDAGATAPRLGLRDGLGPQPVDPTTVASPKQRRASYERRPIRRELEVRRPMHTTRGSRRR